MCDHVPDELELDLMVSEDAVLGLESGDPAVRRQAAERLGWHLRDTPS